MNVQTLSRPAATMSIEEFFAWSEAHAERYELIEGKPRLQPWVKRNHNRIVVNIVQALGRTLDASRFEIATGDFAIPTGPHSVRYADVMVETVGGSGQARVTDSAVLVIEVLSPSTAAEDFGRKQREYLSLPTLDTYLIAAQDTQCLWQWTRDANGNWPDSPEVITEGETRIETLDVTLTLAEIYRNVSRD